MKATFKEMTKPCAFRISDRKEKHFYEEYTAVCFNGKSAYDAVILRLYGTESKSYCCLWVHGNCAWEGCMGDAWRSGSGNAGGYGYHRASAAAARAIENAGIELDEDIGGRGSSKIEEAVRAIAIAMWGDSAYVHVSHSNP